MTLTLFLIPLNASVSIANFEQVNPSWVMVNNCSNSEEIRKLMQYKEIH